MTSMRSGTGLRKSYEWDKRGREAMKQGRTGRSRAELTQAQCNLDLTLRRHSQPSIFFPRQDSLALQQWLLKASSVRRLVQFHEPLDWCNRRFDA